MRNVPKISLEQIAEGAMLEYGFTPYFNQAALNQIKRLKSISFTKKDGRRDLRDLLWSSIDNNDSQDLDQLEHCERVHGGGIKVKIAIADVDYYVNRADAIDKHASHNATSVYTGVTIFPMLPQGLSHHLSSLLPGQDRLVIIVEYNVKKDGQITSGDVYEAWVTNKAQLIYEQVGAWLDNPIITPGWMIRGLDEQLRLQAEATQRLRDFRRQEGMLEFETIESKPIMEGGHVKSLYSPKRTLSNSIIEQFMIAANQTMVHFLTQHDWPTIQRIVRVPERWGRIVEVAQEYGHRLSAEPDPIALKKFLTIRQQRDPARFPDLSLTVIKLLGRGEYEMVNPGKLGHGHFGLAVGHYTHSTAPNRRYVDLIIQRLVKAAISKSPCPYTKRELVEHAAWCTERDASSKKVERFMRKVAAIELLQKHIGETFQGIVTGSSPKGTYVRLLNPPVEGRVVRHYEKMNVGQSVRVRLLRLDITRGFIDFQGI